MPKVQRIGSYIETDTQGFLKPIAAAVNIGDTWQVAVRTLVQAYLDRWGEGIHSIYLRGSIVKGLAQPGISDIDSFAVLHKEYELTEAPDAFAAWDEETERQIQQQFPFVAGIETGLERFVDVLDRANVYAFIVKTEAVCIYGEDLAGQLEPYSIDRDMAFQTQWFGRHLAVFWENYPKALGDVKLEYIVWLMRRFLRLGMELVMVQERRFTSDLYLCYESFAKHYPEQEREMYRALELTVNPESRPEVEGFVREFGGWLALEAERKLAT